MSDYIISCDCATHIFGWSIINKDDCSLVDYGEITSYEQDVLTRTYYMTDMIQTIIKRYKEHLKYMIVEDVPRSKKNLETTVVLSKLNGAILFLGHKYNLTTKLIYPTQWQGALQFKRGIDTKQQSIEWVNNKYNLELTYVSKHSKKNQDNVADSIAMACVVLGNYERMSRYGRKSRLDGVSL